MQAQPHPQRVPFHFLVVEVPTLSPWPAARHPPPPLCSRAPSGLVRVGDILVAINFTDVSKAVYDDVQHALECVACQVV
jgi:hypothetical protein